MKAELKTEPWWKRWVTGRGQEEGASAEPLFEPDFSSLLESLTLIARKRFAGILQAERRSRVLGVGLEFADHRPYVPGDDLRRIDWNIAGRTGRLMLRRFEEEEDLSITIVVDISSSMNAGAPSRRRRGLRLAAALAYIGLVGLDRVGIELVSDRVCARFPLVRGRGQVLRILKFLDSAPEGGETDLQRALKEVVSRAPRKGLVILITDGFDEEGFIKGLQLLRHEGFDVNVIRLTDDRESDPAPLGDIRVVDAETGMEAQLTLTPGLAKKLAVARREMSKRLQERALALGAGYQERPVQEGFVDSVLRTLHGGQVIGHRSAGRSGEKSWG